MIKVSGASMLITALLLAGCSSGNSKSGDESAPKDGAELSKEPVTLVVFNDGGTDESEFVALVQQQLKKTNPHITLDVISTGKGSTLVDLITAGKTPDIVLSYNGNLASFQQQNMLYDMMPLIKKHKMDLNRFESYIIDDVKIASTNDELYGMPIMQAFHTLYYNKDIFDKFGVSHPKDGMTWNDVMELTRKVTRYEDGVQFRGFDTGNVIWPTQPLGIAAIDYKTDKATMSTDQWKSAFNLLKAIYSIPGNATTGKAQDNFIKDRNVAMLGTLNIISALEAAAKDGFNWDVVQYPSYPEKPNTYGNASVNTIMITPTSRYKDQAMLVVEAAVSDEVQMESSKVGRLTTLKNPEVKKAFGASRDGFKNKNVQGIFKSRPVKYPIASTYRSKAEAIAKKVFTQFLQGEFDVNTALARGDEEINKMVAAEKAK